MGIVARVKFSCNLKKSSFEVGWYSYTVRGCSFSYSIYELKQLTGGESFAYRASQALRFGLICVTEGQTAAIVDLAVNETT